MELTEIIRVFGALLVVIALMVGVLHLIKRAGMPGVKSARASIRISAQCALGGRERLIVAEVDSRRFLLGVSPQGITKLSELETNKGESDQPEAAVPQILPQVLSRWLRERQA